MKAATTTADAPETMQYIFQSTPPVKAATDEETVKQITGGFQSTPPVKAATNPTYLFNAIVLISIHAAREGGDPVML